MGVMNVVAGGGLWVTLAPGAGRRLGYAGGCGMASIQGVSSARRTGTAATVAAVVAAMCVVLTASPASAAAPAYIQIPGSPFAAGASSAPAAVAYSPRGGLVATAN